MRRAAAAVLALPAAAAACGASTPSHPQSAAACAATARAELVRVAHRIYDQAVSGRNEVAAVARIHRSAKLARAVAARDPLAVRAALKPLIKNRITRIDVSAGGRTLARFGTVRAYAPVRGVVTDGGRVVGRYVLSVGDDRAFEAITEGLTGARVRFGGAAAASFPATLFPARRTIVALHVPVRPPVVCGSSAADTRAATIGLVGQNLINAESRGPSAQQALSHAAATPAFRRAIAAGDPVAVRNAIIGFFRDSRFHIVRVRAWTDGRLITDVGGPYVLSPASRTIPGGGRFMLSVQDDTGFIKLMHRFTGADVVLHMAGKTVPGSNVSPGPRYAPGLTNVTYGGRSYRDFGFTARAFPTGQLRVSLLVT